MGKRHEVTYTQKRRGRKRKYFAPIKEGAKLKEYVSPNIHRVCGQRMEGYWVRISKNAIIYSKVFSTHFYGDAEALLMAQAYRQRIAEIK